MTATCSKVTSIDSTTRRSSRCVDLKLVMHSQFYSLSLSLSLSLSVLVLHPHSHPPNKHHPPKIHPGARGSVTSKQTKKKESGKDERGKPRPAAERGGGGASGRGRDGGRHRVDGMTRRAGEPSTKRAKVDEAKEEEDPLVRRREELVRLLVRARRAKGSAGVKKELLTLCAKLEAKNEKLLGRLLPELWQKILDEYLDQNDMVALAMTCRFFRDTTKDLGKKVETNLEAGHLLDLRDSGKVASHSLGWFRWVCDTFEILRGFRCPRWETDNGAVYKGTLVNYAAYQGSVEILRWLMEDKGWETNLYTVGEWAGFGGSVEVLEHLEFITTNGHLSVKGYEFDRMACSGAAQQGHLEALKFLRGLDPPCPWDEETCDAAVWGGHLEVLKWLRAQDPPCPWDEKTCENAAERGHLDVLKWLRAQDPPCPWDATTCSWAAKGGHLEVLKWLRAQNPPCPWGKWTCAQAVEGGHLDVLKWLRAQEPPCPWSTSTCSSAAEGGHLEVLKWLRAQIPPCPWDWWTCREAAQGGHLEVLKWLRAQNPPCPWSRRGCRTEASNYGHQHIVQWIDQQEDEIME